MENISGDAADTTASAPWVGGDKCSLSPSRSRTETCDLTTNMGSAFDQATNSASKQGAGDRAGFESDGKASLHSGAESLSTGYHSDADAAMASFSKEISNILDFGTTEAGEKGKDESKIVSTDHGTELGPLRQGAQESTATDNLPSKIDGNTEVSSVDETTSFAHTRPASPIMDTHRRNSSFARRRHRPLPQMESISETGLGVGPSVQSEMSRDNEAALQEDDFVDVLLSQADITSEGHCPSNTTNMGRNDNGDPSIQSIEHGARSTATSTSASLILSTRRRIRTSSESTRSVGGNSSSTGSAHGGSTGSGIRLRRGRRRMASSYHSATESSRSGRSEDNPGSEDTDRRRRNSSGNTLVASLDAGMATLRRWIRTRRLSLGSGTGAGSSSGQSVSSMTTMRLSEEDIFALSQSGSDPRRVITGASSTSSDPNTNLLESNNGSGFLYYRPFEVHVHHDVDSSAEMAYGSDDESASRSLLLHPLVPSTESSSLDGGDGGEQSRQRAYSEPDRARVDFFSSIYGSRAIDGGHALGTTTPGRNLRGSLERAHRPSVPTSPMIIEEEADATEQDAVISEPVDTINGAETTDAPVLESSDVTAPTTLLNSENATGTLPARTLESGESLDNDIVDIEEGGVPNESAPNTEDPNRQARVRWIRINRRFRCIVSSVAVLFSLLLFFIVMAWVLLTSTYVLSRHKQCDVPLRGYFWLVSIQLMLDIFRADIMKWLCRWRTDSHRRMPPRVLVYNIAYLIYAMLVLRMGVESVFIDPSTCSSTAPELFYASLVYVTLSLMAWATLFLGYLVPFCFVAIILMRNGYFPNGDITSSHGVMGGRRAQIGTGRINEMVGEVFPNTYSNPAPPGCVDHLGVVLLNELPDSYQKDCCICMMEFQEGEVLVTTPCEHIFHKRCCHEWLQLARTCPVCRTDLPEALGMTEDEEGVRDEAFSSGRGDQPRREIPNLMRYLGRERSRANDEHSSADAAEVPRDSSVEQNHTQQLDV